MYDYLYSVVLFIQTFGPIFCVHSWWSYTVFFPQKHHFLLFIIIIIIINIIIIIIIIDGVKLVLKL